jgi:hypothetical protein
VVRTSWTLGLQQKHSFAKEAGQSLQFTRLSKASSSATMASKLLSPNTALISTPRPHHYQRPPQITRTLDGQPPDTTTVASAQNQCFSLDAESIAVRLAFRRVACLALASSDAKSSTPANQHLVRPHLQPTSTVVCCHRQWLPDPKRATSNPTNRQII